MKAKFSLATIFVLLQTIWAAPPTGDVCHVYVLDTKAAKLAVAKYMKTNDPKALAKAQTIFPSFETRILEEVTTTQHYRFPGSNLIITASVYYTDESMGSKVGTTGEINPESMLLGITISKKKEQDAISNRINNAVAEVGYDDKLSKVRVKKSVTVNQKLYLVGLECDCNAKRETKK